METEKATELLRLDIVVFGHKGRHVARVRKIMHDGNRQHITIYNLSKMGEWIHTPEGEPCPDECLFTYCHGHMAQTFSSIEGQHDDLF